MIDSHCHLDYLDKSFDEVKKEANELGVKRFLTIGVEESHWEKLLAFGENEDVDVALGIHPCDVDKAKKGWEKRLLKMASSPKVVALGETGLDYYHDVSFKDLQKEAFQAHIDIASQLNKPIVVHMRDSRDDVIKTIKSSGVKGVLHCFTEDYKTACQAIDAGFYISISGIVTFKNASQIQEVARKIPLDSMLIETDSPFLAPDPYRGKKNYPGYVYYVAKKISELRGISIEEVSLKTTENYYKMIS